MQPTDMGDGTTESDGMYQDVRIQLQGMGLESHIGSMRLTAL